MDKSKIAQMRKVGEWTHKPTGQINYTFHVLLENGVGGEVNAKSETPWYGIGTEVAYQDRGVRGSVRSLKLDRPEYQKPADSKSVPSTDFKGSDVGKRILASWAIETAVRLLPVEQDSTGDIVQIYDPKRIEDLADQLVKMNLSVQSRIQL